MAQQTSEFLLKQQQIHLHINNTMFVSTIVLKLLFLNTKPTRWNTIIRK